MSLPKEVQSKLLEILKSDKSTGNICLELNLLLWSLDAADVAVACQIIGAHGKCIDSGQIRQQIELRQKWPDPQAVINSLQAACQQFPLSSRPLIEGGQTEVCVLLDFAEWVNADPEFVLQTMEQIRQKTIEAGDEGYARLQYKNEEYHRWSFPVNRNQSCFIAASLATYTQYAPSTCRKVFMSGIRSCAGGLFNFKRRSSRVLDADAGQFTFWGVTDAAMQAALDRQRALSHRIYDGGWS